MAKYTIEIYSRGVETGIGKISKEQYEYWCEQDEEDLGEALNQNIDQDEVPENARFPYYYSEYDSVAGVGGPDADNSTLVIKEGEDTEIFNDEFETFFDGEAGTGENLEEANNYNLDFCEPGYYLYWAQGGKGCYFQGEVEVDTFNPVMLKFKTTIVQGIEVVTEVWYGDTEVENFGGDWWGKWAEYTVHHIE